MVKYKDHVLARNSQAYQMWLDKDFKQLDKHLKELELKNKQLEEK